MSLNSFAQPLAGAAAGTGAGRKRGELEGVEQGSHHSRAPFPREGMTERAGRGATGKGRYDSGRRLEGAACRDLCLRAAGAWPMSQAKSKPVDGGPRRSPAHADLLPQPAPWPLPLTVRVGLGHHHLLFPGPSPGRGHVTLSPLLDDAGPLGLGVDFPTESCRRRGEGRSLMMGKHWPPGSLPQ